jgi:hypothetical protein
VLLFDHHFGTHPERATKTDGLKFVWLGASQRQRTYLSLRDSQRLPTRFFTGIAKSLRAPPRGRAGLQNCDVDLSSLLLNHHADPVRGFLLVSGVVFGMRFQC